MKLSEVKTYVLGVLRGAFKNKNLLDNLSLSDNNKVCYDNHPINSMDRCYRYETTLWEGNMTSTATVNLTDDYTQYDELLITWSNSVRDPMRQLVTEIVKVDEVAKGKTYILSHYSTEYQILSFPSNTTMKVQFFSGQECIQKLIGIKYTPVPDVIKAVEYYDTEEQVVGRWVDGRPVYRKVFIATKTTTGETSYPIKTVLGLNSIKDFHLIRENIAQFDAPNNFSGSGYFFAANTDFLGSYWNVSNNNLIVRGGSNWPKIPFTFCYVAEYTKTADAADSFSPDLIHNPLTRYSTEETKIGEWVDGKPIYRKMFELPNSVTLESAKWYKTNISITDLNIEHLINGKLLRTSTSTYDAFGSIDFDISTGYIRLLRGTGITLGSSLIFIEYTKTTD